MEENKNPRPVEEGTNIPSITLLVLIALIGALLYVGWEYLSDGNSEKDNELTNVRADSAAVTTSNSEQAISAASDDASDEKPSKKKVSADEEEVSSKDKKKVEVVEEEASSDETTISHTVREGETFFGIANRYNISKATLKKLNPEVDPNGIKVGVTRLKVKVRAIHTVGPGDVLRVVAKKYGISKALLMQANKKDKDLSERGEKLIIPLK
jgi:LysM repeat protein